MKNLSNNQLLPKVEKLLSENYAKAGRSEIWTTEETEEAIKRSGEAAKRMIESGKNLGLTDQRILEIAASPIPKGSLSIISPRATPKDDIK